MPIDLSAKQLSANQVQSAMIFVNSGRKYGFESASANGRQRANIPFSFYTHGDLSASGYRATGRRGYPNS
jgi:hypothetical protein